MNKNITTNSASFSAFFSQGFRPFFLSAALWAGFSIFLWVLLLSGTFELPSAFSPVSWHAHALLFGYTPAVIAGFLLTAVPNWTGRRPIGGGALIALYSLWVGGRIAVFFSEAVSWPVAAVIDLSFTLVLATVIARELILAKSYKNLRVVGLLVALSVANGLFHLGEQYDVFLEYGFRLGLSSVLAMIMLIGGRIIPAFTRNWLVRNNVQKLPVMFGRFDMVVIGFSVAGLLAWSFTGLNSITASMFLLAAALNAARMSRWQGHQCVCEPLLLILHVAYAFLPLGFVALSTVYFVPELVGIAVAMHLWTVGAIGMMTMAVMTRASLGHTGQPLQSSWLINTIYLMLLFSVLLRVCVELFERQGWLLHISATFWVMSFLLFVLSFAKRFFKKS